MTLEEFLENKTWNPTLIDAGEPKKKILQMRLQMKPGTTLEQMKISVNGHDLRVEVNNKISGDTGRALSKSSRPFTRRPSLSSLVSRRTQLPSNLSLSNLRHGSTENRTEGRRFSSHSSANDVTLTIVFSSLIALI